MVTEPAAVEIAWQNELATLCHVVRPLAFF